jgi:rubrerythrin
MSDAAKLALEEAIRLESDGRDFYEELASRLKNPFAKKLFSALAKEEVDHIDRVRAIYEKLKGAPGWPSVASMIAKRSGVLNIFLKEDLNTLSIDATTSEAAQKALEMEIKGLAFYQKRVAKATCAAEKEFFEALVVEEEEHKSALEKTLALFS